MARQLIVNADDYGRSAGVSRGILDAHRNGIVTSTTAMVNLEKSGAHMAEALACPRLGLGLHLVFSSWKPVLPPEAVPGLVDGEGFFLDQHRCWARAGEVPVDQLCAELSAQVARFVELAGRSPDHLDCHQLVHLHPRLFEVYLDVAARHGLPVRVPFAPDVSRETQVALGPFLQGLAPQRLREMVETDARLLAAYGAAHPDRSLLTFFGRDALTLERLLEIIESVPEGVSELMCHPGYADEELGRSGYRSEREVELRLLTHPAAAERTRALGIELVTFAAVAPRGPAGSL